MDLKILKKSGKKEIGILYIHDEFSKLIKGQVINDKNRDTIIQALENKWIIGGGLGPGHPTKGFFSDNGGEFLNEDLIDFAASLNISIKMTSASSPWSNGSCERAHATVDKIVEKMLEDDPKIGLQKAVDWACFVKNTEINKTGFSPMQLFTGKSPTFPGLSDCSPANIHMEGNNEYLNILRRMDIVRNEARKIDCDQRMKTALKSKINSSLGHSYNLGDSVFFKLDSSNRWKSGTVLGQDGKLLFLRYGNFIRRVPLDHIIPSQDSLTVPEVNIDENDVENENRLLDDDFKDVENVVLKQKEIEELRKQNLEQKQEIKLLEKQVLESQSEKKPLVIESRLPKRYQQITFQVDGKEFSGKVMTKHKNSSSYRNILGIRLDDGTEKEYDFSRKDLDWQDSKASVIKEKEFCCLHSTKDEEPITHEIFATILNKSQVKERKVEVEEAMKAEIQKFESFSAFKVVDDQGQHAIKTRWVFSEADDESKGTKLKARLCMRGDTELDAENIRADSPTTQKDTLKLALAIAANENFELVSADIKSAFLQGQTLDRNVFVVPPLEANVDGVLWKLEKAAYGLVDGSRLFYLKLKSKLELLGMREVSGEPGLFTMHKDDNLVGLICSHVDDLFIGGNEYFKANVVKKLFAQFKFSKVEEKKFKYLGCEVEKHENGNITLNQNEYIEKIKEVEVPSRRNSSKTDETERRIIRRVVGELLWVSLMTRPDLCFEVNCLSSNIEDSTIKELKDAKRLVEKAKLEPLSLTFTRIGPKEHIRIKIYTDASFNNQDRKLKSTEGRVLVLENSKSSKCNVFSWKTKRISRVCRSVKAAETRALENGLDDAVHFARMVHEIYSGVVDLKHPKQIEVNALTDNKGLFENLNNTRQCEEKLLRNSVALIKQMVENKEVKNIEWVETSEMLADTLTKKGGNGSWLKHVITRNVIK